MSYSFVADRIRQLPPSGIRKFFDIASQIDDVVSLGVGEPDFDTPWHITYEGIYALEKGKTHYTSNSGLIELREEIHHYMRRKFNLEYNPESEILVTVGASEAIDLIMRTILTPGAGEEVLIIEPCFVSYKPCVVMAGGVPVPVSTKEEDDFRLTPLQLKAHITPKTKAMIMAYPSNPTGAIMEKEDLEKIAQVLKDENILVISDEIYAELTYGSKHISIASINGMYNKTIIHSGFSKAYAMTGWRLGFTMGPKEIISEMTKIHQYVIMCAPTPSQYAGLAALKNGDADIEEMCQHYEARRNVMLNGIRDIGLSCFEPKGAFYLFPSIKSTGLSSEKFCELLLQEEKVVVVPGNAFGDCGEGFFRCSYAYSIEDIKFALAKIEKFITKQL